MPIGVIDLFKIVNVANSKTAILQAKLRRCFFQIGAIVQPGERIVISNLQKTFILLFQNLLANIGTGIGNISDIEDGEKRPKAVA